jgi:DNA primase
MEIEGLNFREALESLAERAGVKLDMARGDRGKTSSRTSGKTRDVLEEAVRFFRESMSGPGGEAARAYLDRRGLSAEDAARFGLGWSPQSWDATSKHMASKGFSDVEIFEAGLSVKSERGSYDRFKGRVIFPIRDDAGRIVGFGGRLIDGEGAKYVNSPEGALFNKRKTLYLMDAAKRSIRERGRAILMEGYMDAIRAHMTGFTETVASLGTSLTEEQAALIKRFTELCYISYDADGAGQNASIRGMYVLARHGVDVRVVALQEGLDPDDALSREGGVSAFASALEKALPLPMYHVRARKKYLRVPGKRRGALLEILTGLASLPMLDIAEYIPAISREIGILEHELRGEIDSKRRELERAERRSGIRENKKSAISAEGIAGDSGVYINDGENAHDRRSLDLECAFCSLLWRDAELRSRWSCGELIPLFADEATSGMIAALASGEPPADLESRWRSMGERMSFERLARGDAVLAGGGLGPEFADALVEAIRTNALKRRLKHLEPLKISGEATSEEIGEYFELMRKLKGRA